MDGITFIGQPQPAIELKHIMKVLRDINEMFKTHAHEGNKDML